MSAPKKPGLYQAVIGPGPHTRAEATSKLWSYIKQNGCQNPENKREIVADAKLRPIFGGAAKATMFEMRRRCVQEGA